jgi:hypothetical protein
MVRVTRLQMTKFRYRYGVCTAGLTAVFLVKVLTHRIFAVKNVPAETENKLNRLCGE